MSTGRPAGVGHDIVSSNWRGINRIARRQHFTFRHFRVIEATSATPHSGFTMRKNPRACATGWIVVALLLATNTASRAAERLVVRAYDNFGVARGEMAIACQAAALILKNAGLQLVWRDCSAGCADALGRGEVMVRIVAAPEAIVAESLGSSVIDLQQGAGTLATVYADRITALASRTGVNLATLLGRAVAHEIGHLILGTANHSASGLMRARWSDRELQRDVAADWIFSREEIRQIGRGLTTRDCEACSVIAHRIQVLPPERQP